MRYSDLYDYLRESGYNPPVMEDFDITGFVPLNEARKFDVTWSRLPFLGDSWPIVFAPGGEGQNVIVVDNPRRVMIKVMAHFIGEELPYISESAVIGDDVAIGDGARIESNVTIHNEVIIGDNCIIGAGSTVGADGFAYEMDGGEVLRFPHVGRVLIGDNVEIANNCCIDRGSLSDTILEDHVKVDNLVHIGHNCHIKEYAALSAGVILGGSTVIGKRAWLGLNCTTKDNITIGEDAIIGIGCVVLHDVKDGAVMVGNPAREIPRKDTHVKYTPDFQEDWLY